ncbi:MAG TPA: hypothetical protein VM889_08715 [Candidatus Thermoplasmatota archaeon]|nr:hypothetical protein [Candidatus Thermoplasmatota archaeon]
MPPKVTVTEERALEELRMLLMLEEGMGARAFRRLRAIAPDDEGRRLVDAVAAASQEMRADLEDVLAAWHRPEREAPPVAPKGLPAEEIVASFVEMKIDEAQILERAAEKAPNENLARRLRALAATQRSHADRLKSIL